MMKTRRSMKKVLALLLCIVMFATLLPTFAFADLAAPTLGSATANGSGIKLTWTKVTGADGYRIYRKTGSNGWGMLVDVGDVDSYQDSTAAAGTIYTYTVRCKSGGNVVSSYDKIGVSGSWNTGSAGYVATPALDSAKAETNGIRFKWKKVSGAAGYKIYRKSGSGSWAGLTSVGDVAEYLDTSVSSGVKYTYTVRALNSGGNIISGYNNTGVSATWTKAAYSVATPKLVGAVAKGSGIEVTWQAVSGAGGYRIYRKTGSGGWSVLTDVSGGSTTSYQDNTAASGKTYSYTVRVLNSSGVVVSDYDKNGVSGSWNSGSTGNLAAPVLKDPAPKTNGVQVNWNAVSGATGYRIYRKTASTSWAKIADVGAVTSYIDTSAQNNTKYTYTVRCLDGGNVNSGYDATGKTIHYFRTPSMVSAAAANDGILVKWNAVGGAPKYLVYRSLDGGATWKRLATTTATQWLDKTADPGISYTYTVRVISSDEKTFLSDYDHTGKTCTFAGKAQVTSLEGTTTGVKVTWKTIAGAVSYEVWRKSGAGEWTKIKDGITSTSYIDTTAVSGTTYTYTVRAWDGSDYVGTYDSTGKSITYLAAPTLVEAKRSDDGSGILFTWEAVERAAKYRVYRKTDSGSYERLADVTGLSYLDTKVPSGTTATYTVRCLDTYGNLASDYDHTGVSALSPTYYAQPLLTGVKSDVGGILVTWQAVDGVEDYRIFRHDTSKTSWDELTDVNIPLGNPCEYLDPDIDNSGDVKEGGKYSYTVACLKSGQVASAKNEVGLTTTYYKAPEMRSATNAVDGVKVTWKAVDGVGYYNIYRKTDNGSWTRIASSFKGTSYVDTSAESAHHYNYSVACVVNGTEMSAYDDVGVATRFYAPPKLVSVRNVTTGVEVKWNAVTGISSYKLFRKANGGSWASVTTVNSDSPVVTYIDTSVTSNTVYTYTVLCVRGGNNASDYNRTGLSVRYLQTPVLVSATGGTKSVKIVWQEVNGADSYDIYRKTYNDSGWKLVKSGAEGSTYTDKNLTTGITYYYTVVAKNANGDRSNFDQAGISAKAN